MDVFVAQKMGNTRGAIEYKIKDLEQWLEVFLSFKPTRMIGLSTPVNIVWGVNASTSYGIV